MRLPSTLRGLGLTLTLCSLAAAQGSDNCSSAQFIIGTGLFSFDNSAATLDGVPHPLCDFFSQQDIDNDVWFSWTAPTSGIYTLQTCGLTAVDTKVAIYDYDGTCSGTVLACNDDSCGSLQTSVTWNTIAGNIYIIRLGTYPGAVGGTGQFDLSEKVPALNPNNGNRYLLVQSSLSWIDADTAAQGYTYNGSQGHLVTFADQAEVDWVVANMGASRPWIGLFHDTTSPNYSEPAGGWAWVTGEPTNYLNWATGEPNNISGSGGPEDYAEMFATGFWNDAELNHLATNEYLIEFEGGLPGASDCDCAGANGPCFNVAGAGRGCPNSNANGLGAMLVGAGNASIANDSFVLDVVDAAPLKPGLILAGSASLGPVGVATVPDSAGILCVGGTTRRGGVVSTDSNGAASFPDFQGAPFGQSDIVVSGTPTSYTYWFRDPGTANGCLNDTGSSDFNFSNGWTTTWQ